MCITEHFTVPLCFPAESGAECTVTIGVAGKDLEPPLCLIANGKWGRFKFRMFGKEPVSHAGILFFENGTRAMRETVFEVNQAMKAVDLAMEENAKGVTEVSETMANLTESMVSLEEQASTNESVAEELNNEVHKFKLD